MCVCLSDRQGLRVSRSRLFAKQRTRDASSTCASKGFDHLREGVFLRWQLRSSLPEKGQWGDLVKQPKFGRLGSRNEAAGWSVRLHPSSFTLRHTSNHALPATQTQAKLDAPGVVRWQYMKGHGSVTKQMPASQRPAQWASSCRALANPIGRIQSKVIIPLKALNPAWASIFYGEVVWAGAVRQGG